MRLAALAAGVPCAPFPGELDAPSVLVFTTVDIFLEAAAALRRYLPDLLVNWASVNAGETAGLRLGGQELMRWEPGQPHDSGRSGNHATEGWFAAIGPGIAQKRDSALRDIDGIVPTVYQWLGEQPPMQFARATMFPEREKAT